MLSRTATALALVVVLVAASATAESFNTVVFQYYSGNYCQNIKGHQPTKPLPFPTDECLGDRDAQFTGFKVRCESAGRSECANFTFNDGVACDAPNAPTAIAESGVCHFSHQTGYYRWLCRARTKSCIVGLHCDSSCHKCSVTRRLSIGHCVKHGNSTVMLNSISKCTGDKITQTFFVNPTNTSTHKAQCPATAETRVQQFWTGCYDSTGDAGSFRYTCSNTVAHNCTIEDDCSNHATSVSGTSATGCNCKCSNSWVGDRCQYCPTNFNRFEDCGACAPGYADYPQCAAMCTVYGNCSGNALSVTGTSDTGCMCTCRNLWTGTQCQTCPPNADASMDCGACAPGYSGYPVCNPTSNAPGVQCSIAKDCNNHAYAAVPVDGVCVCNCQYQWVGSSCNVCASNYAGANCDKCAAGYSNFPLCVRICTNANCSNHASSVSGDDNTGCTCTCRNAWQGATCNICPANFNAADDCASCAKGYINYPFCTSSSSSPAPSTSPSSCTSEKDCNNHASAVTGTAGQCKCICRNMWKGDQCQTCPVGVSASEDCGACTTGYAGYPNCSRMCTLALDCNNNAVSVEGVTPDCSCVCRNMWNGPSCSVCPKQYDVSADCGACAPGYSGYPFCSPIATPAPSDTPCTIIDNCNNNARRVTGTVGTGCHCHCRNKYQGATCAVCPPRYDPYTACGSCAVGYQSYPDCYLKCTVVANCSSHAYSVSGDTEMGCTCKCRNGWAGYTCEECPSNFNATNDCGSCAAGYEEYPLCVKVSNSPAAPDTASTPSSAPPVVHCTKVNDCHGHATSVKSVDGQCVCTCRNMWTGAQCQSCPLQYNSTLDCGDCAAGFSGLYPHCVPNGAPTTVPGGASKSEP